MKQLCLASTDTQQLDPVRPPRLRCVNSRGFTIVELLIVIVIIAILAVISIVMYNGISKRAQNAESIAHLRQVQDAVVMYENEHRIPPLFPLGGTGASGGASSAICIGEGYPGGQCAESEKPVKEDPRFCKALAQYVSCPGPIAGADRTVSYQPPGMETPLTFKNAVYFDFQMVGHPTNYAYSIVYALAGNSSCVLSGSAVLRNYIQDMKVTLCQVTTIRGDRERWCNTTYPESDGFQWAYSEWCAGKEGVVDMM